MTLSHFNSPFDVVQHPQLEPEVKRAILASWASDAHAVDSHAELLQPPEVSRPLRLSEVAHALRNLDTGTS